MSRSLMVRLVVALVATSVYVCANASESSGSSVIALEKPVHFSSADDKPVVVPAGKYRVGYGGDSNLQLIPEGTSDPIEIRAVPTTHDESVDSLLAFSVSNAPDEYHVILWLPGGTGLDARGSYSGVQSRAVGTLDQQTLRSAAQVARKSNFRDWGSPVPDLVVTASTTPSSPILNQPFSIRVYIINQGQADATLVRQTPANAHISLQTFDAAGNTAGGTSFFIQTLPLTIPAGGSRYVDLPSAPLLNRAVGTFYWQFTLYSFITESNTTNNVGPRMPVTVRAP